MQNHIELDKLSSRPISAETHSLQSLVHAIRPRIKKETCGFIIYCDGQRMPYGKYIDQDYAVDKVDEYWNSGKYRQVTCYNNKGRMVYRRYVVGGEYRMADYFRQRIEALEAHEKNLLREHKELSEMHYADGCDASHARDRGRRLPSQHRLRAASRTGGERMTLDFFLAMDPPRVTAQEKKVAVIRGKPVMYEPQPLKDARIELEWMLKPHRPSQPLSGAICLTVKWYFCSRIHKEGELKITKPDTDNLEKMLKDCMTRTGYWNDDAQVAVEYIYKMWTKTKPGIRIRVAEIDKDVVTDEQY